jgi:UDP-N-acetylmuramoyl-tripeptide--D-alanyl-D-alanine ligase
MLQQNRYNRGYRYIKWILKNYKENFINPNLLFLVFIFSIFSNTLNNISTYLFILIYLFLTYIYVDARKKETYKLPLKYTARIKRLIVTISCLYLIPGLLMFIFFNEQYIGIYYFILGLLSYINYFVVLAANVVNRPVEKLVGKHFEKQAKEKLASMTNMEVIGVTGSYGKTSTKNILHDILNVKYSVFKTPANFNTPFGLMITINEHLDKYNDFFIFI